MIGVAEQELYSVHKGENWAPYSKYIMAAFQSGVDDVSGDLLFFSVGSL